MTPEPRRPAAAPPVIWVLADPRAGTAAQALGIAERLGLPFRTLALRWGRLGGAAIPWPSLLGLSPEARAALLAAHAEAPPDLVIAAGRRAGPVARWLGRRGARLVHAMRPGFGAGDFALLVVGAHDAPRPAANLLPILGATHRMSPARLAAARAEFAALEALPRPRIALLLGGPLKAAEGSTAGLPADFAAALGRQVASQAGSVLASTSRRTGAAATAALAASLAPAGAEAPPHRLFRWGDAGPNPYAGFLAWADAVVVTGDSTSMLSEATATAVPVFIATLPASQRKHVLWQGLAAAGAARLLTPESLLAGPPRPPLDETGRVATAIHARGLLTR